MVLIKALIILIVSSNKLDEMLTQEKYIPSLKLLCSLGLIDVHIAPDLYVDCGDGEPIVGKDKVYSAEKTLKGRVTCWAVRIFTAGVLAVTIRILLL